VDLPLHWNTRGICHISQGDYAGNILLNDSPYILPNMLYIVSYAGNLIAEVTAVDFAWDLHCEGITQITSGPYQGNFAMIGITTLTGWDTPHIFVFEIENVGGSVKAYLVKDISTTDLGAGLLSIAFIPDDYLDPQYRNHFVCTDVEPEPGSDPPGFFLRVIDDNGILKIKYPLSYIYEGLAYISKGPYKDKFVISTPSAMESWIRSLDGSEKIPYDISVGFGILAPRSVACLEASDQFMIGNPYSPGPRLNLIPSFNFLSRLGQEIWVKNDEKEYSGFRTHHDITELTADESYYMLGYYYVPFPGQWVYEVHSLDSDFTLKEIYSLPTRFYIICYIPGSTFCFIPLVEQ